jgi:Rieske Fe-S protein
VHQALYWDTADPYHYVRIQKGPREDFILIGGEDHKTGQNEDSANRYRRLESWARKRFRSITSFDYCWSGQVMEPADGLAFIGRNPLDEPNVFIATGDSGQGMTHGTIAGMLLTDLIMGRPNPWTELYDPSRINIRAIGKVAQENLNAAAQYGAWVTGGDVDSVDLIPRDSGGILRRGLRKMAVYKDAGGVVHERSAVCPHMGCIVHWNGGEKTWDCPCHGSRFGRLGDVINGPANRGLAKEPAEEESGPDRRFA